MAVPQVSVILPAFNPPLPQLAAAAASVLSQEGADLELIVVDDGSTPKLLADLLPDARVVLHRQPNRGVAAARKAGLQLARGELIAFLDHDDTWTPRSLSRRLTVLDRQPADVAGVLSAPIGPNAGGGESPWFEVKSLPPGQDRVLSRAEYCDLQRRHGYLLLQGAVLRRDAIIAAGGFDDTLFAGEDQDLLFRLLHRGRLTFLQEACFRRMRPGMTVDPRNEEKIAWSSYQMVRKQIPDVRRSWRRGEARAFWSFHDSCVRRCLRKAVELGDRESASSLRRCLRPLRSARNLRSWLRSFA